MARRLTFSYGDRLTGSLEPAVISPDTVSSVTKDDTIVSTILTAKGVLEKMDYKEVKTLVRTINSPVKPGVSITPHEMDSEITALLSSGWKLITCQFMKWQADDGWSLLWILGR